MKHKELCGERHFENCVLESGPLEENNYMLTVVKYVNKLD